MKIPFLLTIKNPMMTQETSKNNLNGRRKWNNNNFWCIEFVCDTDLFYILKSKITEFLRRNGIFMGKLRTANYWPFMKCDRIGLSALYFQIIAQSGQNIIKMHSSVDTKTCSKTNKTTVKKRIFKLPRNS